MSFFETYKRPIFLVVSIFALITFSITGVMLSFLGGLTQPEKSPETLALPSGERVHLRLEDLEVARRIGWLHRLTRGGAIDMPAFVFERVDVEDPAKTFELLRRIAVERGIDVSDEDVNAVLDHACRQKEAQQPGGQPPERLTRIQIAANVRAGSIATLEETVREALRISMLVRSEMQGADLSEAALADYVKKKRKLRTISYVYWDGKKYREELERNPPTNPELEAWIATLDDAGRRPYVNDVVVRFASAGLLFDQVDPAEWTTMLDGIEIGDSEIQARYDIDKESLYKLPDPPKEDDKKDGDKGDGDKGDGDKGDGDKGDGDKDKKNESRDGGLLTNQDPAPSGNDTDPAPKSQDQPQGPEGPQPPKQDENAGDETKKDQGPIGPLPPEQIGYRRIDEVKEEIRRKLQVEQLVRKLSEAAEKARSEAVEAVRKAADAKKGEAKGGEKPTDGGEVKDPEKVDAAKNDDAKKDDESKDGGLLAQGEPGEVSPQGSPEDEAARLERQKAEFAAFDFDAWFDANMKGKKGVVFVPAKPTVAPPDAFQDYEPFGKWNGYWALSQMTELGTLSNLQPAEKGAFFFRLIERQTGVPKAIDEVREQALEGYYATKSSSRAKTEAEAFQKLVREKAEALKADEVAKLKADSAAEVDAKLETWRDGLQANVKRIEASLARTDLPAAAIPKLQQELADARTKLALEKDERKRLQDVADEKLEDELVKLLEPVMAEAFDTAVAEAKIETAKLGPFFIDVSSSGAFQMLEDGAPKFLQANRTVLDAKKGAVTDPLEDAALSRQYIVRVDDVQDGDDSAITRQAMETNREAFLGDRLGNLLTYSFDLRALRKRYAFQTDEKAASMPEGSKPQ
ncbi:MAG: hypothetical protein H6832_08830 [Planctomycetes bacterium]|nr:hypothetical protein [Planctomycetota bacterium]MCB9918494.1 hypothetical protein [Planctomycetota bacterium]